MSLCLRRHVDSLIVETDDQAKKKKKISFNPTSHATYFYDKEQLEEILDIPEIPADNDSLSCQTPVKRLVNLVKSNGLIPGDKKHTLYKTISLKFNRKQFSKKFSFKEQSISFEQNNLDLSNVFASNLIFKQKSKDVSLLNVVQKIQFAYRKKCLLQRLMKNNEGIDLRLIRYTIYRGLVLWMYYLWGNNRMTLEVAVIDPVMAMRNTKVLRLHISHAYFHQTATYPFLARLVQVQGENILITSLSTLAKQLDKVTKVWLAKSLHKLMQVFFYKNSKVFLLK